MKKSLFFLLFLTGCASQNLVNQAVDACGNEGILSYTHDMQHAGYNRNKEKLAFECRK